MHRLLIVIDPGILRLKIHQIEENEYATEPATLVATLAEQIGSPRIPVVLRPALADAGEIVLRNVDVDKLDTSSIFLWPEGKR
jgi:hypothetical protein